MQFFLRENESFEGNVSIGIVSVTHENERTSIKKQFTLHKMCVTSLLCGPCGNYCKRFIERENRLDKNP